MSDCNIEKETLNNVVKAYITQQALRQK